MVVLITCKNEEDPIENVGARVFTTLYINFSDAQGQIPLELVMVSGRNLNSSAVLGPIWPNFELVRDVILVTCKYEEDPIKNEGARVLTTFYHIITIWELSVAMETRVPTRSGPKPNAAFWLYRPAGCGDIYVLKCEQTD